MAEAPQPSHLQKQLKSQWAEARWRLCAESLLPISLHHAPETAESSGILRSLCLTVYLPVYHPGLL